MKMKSALVFLFAGLLLAASLSADARKRKKRRSGLRKWSVTAVNGYSFLQTERPRESEKPPPAYDGQMKSYFSSLDLARNFGYFEAGARLQFYEEAFVSPFIKWNFIKNTRRRTFIPYMITGLSISSLGGVYARLGLSLFFKRYFALSPFVGTYFWYKMRGESKVLKPYSDYNWLFHGGMSLSIYL